MSTWPLYLTVTNSNMELYLPVLRPKRLKFREQHLVSQLESYIIIRKKYWNLICFWSGEDRSAVIQLIVKELEEARDIVIIIGDSFHNFQFFLHNWLFCQLEQMGLEIRDLNSTARTKYQTRIQSHSTELTRLENEFRQTKMLYAKQREELLGEFEETDDQSRQLIDNTERLERGNRRLESGYKIAIETEELGNSILTDLDHQRETMQKTRSRVN